MQLGDWKIVRQMGKPWELYDLAEDPEEKADLAGQHPQRVEAMKKVNDDFVSDDK